MRIPIGRGEVPRNHNVTHSSPDQVEEPPLRLEPPANVEAMKLPTITSLPPKGTGKAPLVFSCIMQNK